MVRELQTLTIMRYHFTLLNWHWLRILGTPLVVQWLRIYLPMQGTRVQSLVRADPPPHRTTKPV